MLRKVTTRIRAFIHSRNPDHEIDEELRFHLEMQARANMEHGMTHPEAQRAAVIRMNGLEQVKEAVRDTHRTFFDSLALDVRYALRTFRRSPGFTAVAIVTLALGIGATTCLYSVVDAALFRPLPYDHPDRIVRLQSWDIQTGVVGEAVTRDVFDAIQNAQTIDSASLYVPFAIDSTVLIRHGEAEVFRTADISASFFRVLGVQPLLGRPFRPEEEQPGQDGVAILDFATWQRSFGGDTGIIGRELPFEDGNRTVVGVMPAGFLYPAMAASLRPDILFPFVAPLARRNLSSFVVARLRSGVPLKAAQAEADVIAARFPARPLDGNPAGIRVLTLQESLAGRLRPSLLQLLGAVAGLLLIACLNVANLLLARGGAREQEFALRAALGASRPRLFRQLLTESVLLSAAGAGPGVLLSSWILPSLLARLPGRFQIVPHVGIDSRVLVVVLAVTAASSLVFGVWPALAGSRANLTEPLKSAGARRYEPQRAGRSLLLVVESALALVLLIGAGLMINTVIRLERIDYGFETHGLWMTRVRLAENRYPDAVRVAQFYDRLEEQLRRIPGVRDVAGADSPPLFGGMVGGLLGIPGRPPLQPRAANVRHVTASYFSTVGMPFVKGRGFTDRDELASPSVAVINESMAKRFWPGQDAIGQTLLVDKKWDVQIIGIVRDVCESPAQNASLRLSVVEPAVYVPAGDATDRLFRARFFLVRTADSDRDMSSPIARQVEMLAPEQRVDVSEYSQNLGRGFAEPRFFALLLGIFGGLGMTLAAVGIGGITAYSVTRKTYEIGIRLALGATPRQVVSTLVLSVLIPVSAGLGLGFGASLILCRMLQRLLYEITPTDPWTFVGVTMVLGLVALIASYVPARRAACIDPMIALKTQ